MTCPRTVPPKSIPWWRCAASEPLSERGLTGFEAAACLAGGSAKKPGPVILSAAKDLRGCS